MQNALVIAERIQAGKWFYPSDVNKVPRSWMPGILNDNVRSSRVTSHESRILNDNGFTRLRKESRKELEPALMLTGFVPSTIY